MNPRMGGNGLMKPPYTNTAPPASRTSVPRPKPSESIPILYEAIHSKVSFSFCCRSPSPLGAPLFIAASYTQQLNTDMMVSLAMHDYLPPTKERYGECRRCSKRIGYLCLKCSHCFTCHPYREPRSVQMKLTAFAA